LQFSAYGTLGHPVVASEVITKKLFLLLYLYMMLGVMRILAPFILKKLQLT
ncbi:hypothetical protein ACJX0J_040205, partial [Zea mays]